MGRRGRDLGRQLEMAEDAGRAVRRLEHCDEPQSPVVSGATPGRSISNTRRIGSAQRQPGSDWNSVAATAFMISSARRSKVETELQR